MAHATTIEASEVKIPQTRLESIVEQAVNTVSGFILAWLAWQFLVPVLVPGLQPSAGQSWAVIFIFTAISIVRGYFWRRFFENGVHHFIKSLIGRFYERK